MDTYLFNLINQFAGKWLWLDILGIFFAEYFEYIIIFGLLVFLVLKFKERFKIVVGAFVAAIVSRLIITNIIRWIWPRLRPFVESNVNLLIDYPNKASFPSGHASFYFALSFVIYMYNKKVGVWFLVGSFIMCLARVFIGIHWPLDILAGIVVGVLSGWVMYLVFKRYKVINR
tara:strand:+ start:294 stop:812 length:519 start_codon:yes stop_codon:yes gene_type:complete